VDDSLVSLLDVTPTLLRLQGLPIPRTMQGAPLPTVSDGVPRDAATPRDCAFSEYGAGGPPFTLEHLNNLPETTGRAALMRSLQWREAEGRRKMVRTRDWKYVHDPMGDADELYHLTEDPGELTNLAADPNYADVLREMALRLADWSIQTEGGPIPVPLPHESKYRIIKS
jgi:arylsulfatase A-like enzyme